jgi:hypothetical protein
MRSAILIFDGGGKKKSRRHSLTLIESRPMFVNMIAIIVSDRYLVNESFDARNDYSQDDWIDGLTDAA